MPQSAEGEGGYLQGAEGEPPESAAPTPQPPSETGHPAGDATAGNPNPNPNPNLYTHPYP